MISFGVPLISPVDGSSDRPDGSAGETDHAVEEPPVTVMLGIPELKVDPLVRVNGFHCKTGQTELHR